MRDCRVIAVFACLAAATAALSHQGVTNPVVRERMNAMTIIGENTKIIGDMAKGTRPFDVDAARKAARVIAVQAERTPDLFAAYEQDPASEAVDEIWANFDDFVAKSEALRVTAERLATRIRTREDLRPALAGLGKACKACHGEYRE